MVNVAKTKKRKAKKRKAREIKFPQVLVSIETEMTPEVRARKIMTAIRKMANDVKKNHQRNSESTNYKELTEMPAKLKDYFNPLNLDKIRQRYESALYMFRTIKKWENIHFDYKV